MTRDDVAFHGCAALTVLALVALYTLRRESSWLCRWLDARLDEAWTWTPEVPS